MRPLLLLDVDGVLALRQPPHDGFDRHSVRSTAGDDHEVWLDPRHGDWLCLLSELFEIVWATGWEHDAPRLLGPLLSVPAWPVLSFSERPRLDRRLDKLPDVMAVAGDRPVAWVDDDPGEAALDWVDRRANLTMVVTPSPDEGLRSTQVGELMDFAARSSGLRRRAGVVLVEEGRLALIERHRDGRTYYVLPGGGVEAGESIADAAKREVVEEVNLDVEVGAPVAHVFLRNNGSTSVQHYLAGRVVRGHLGPGTGPEYSAAGSGRGTYRPVWVPLSDIAELDVRPRAVADAVISGLDLELPLIVGENVE